MVPKVGVEPTPPCEDRILNPARLPIPPLWLLIKCITKIVYGSFFWKLVGQVSLQILWHLEGFLLKWYPMGISFDNVPSFRE